MQRTVIALILSFVMLTGAALGGLFDLGGASKLLSGAASHLLERELRIDGELELRLGPRPRIAARDIVLANPPWAGGDLLRIEQLELELDLLSLWQRPVRIEYLRIAGARLDLIEREDGSTNWDFAAAADTPKDPPGLELPPLISDGLVTDSLVRYLRPDLDSPAELTIDRLANYLDATDTLQLDLQGSIGELPLRVSGQAGAYSAMLSGNNMIFDLQLALGRYRLAMDGALGDLARLEGLQMKGQLTGPDSTVFYEALNFSQTDAGPVDLSASVNDLATGLSWSVLGQFGSLTVDIDGTVRVPLELDGLESTVAIAGNNLDLVAGWLDIHTLPAEAFQLAGSVKREGTHLQLRDVEFRVGEALLRATATAPHFPGTRDLQVDAGIEGPSFAPFRELLGLQGDVDAPFDLDVAIEMKSDALEILDSTLRVGSVRLTAAGPIGDHPGFEGSELRLELEGDNLADLLAEAGIDHGPVLSFQGGGLVRMSAPNKLDIAESQLTLGGLIIQLEGEIDDLSKMDNSDLRIHIDTESLGNAMGQLGHQGLPELPASLDARLHGPIAAPTIDNLEVQLGDARLTIEGALQGFPTLDGTEARLEGEIPGPVDWLPEPLRQRLAISSSLRGSDQQLWLEDLSVTGSNWQARGSLQVSDLERGLGTLGLSIQGAKLAGLLPPEAHFQPASVPFELHANLQRAPHGINVNLFQLQAAGNRLDLSGALSDQDDAALTVNLRGDSLASLGELDGAVLPDQAYALRGRVKQSGNFWSVAKLELRLGGEELLGSLRIHQLKRPRYVVKLQSGHFNFGQFLPPAKSRADPDPAAQARANTLLIPDRPLPLAWLDSFDAELHLDLAGLDIPDRRFPELITLDKLRLDAMLEAGQLNVRQLQLAGDRGTVTAPMTLRWQDGMLDIDAKLLSDQFKLSILSPSYNIDGLPVQRIRSRFMARGSSPHQLAANLNGYLLIESGPGKMVNGDMELVFDSFTSQLLETINPFFGEDEFTQLKCGVIGIQFDEGEALLDPGTIFRTSKIDIMATGNVQLATEAIHLDIATKARKGLGFSAGSLITPYLQVGGTLASPQLEIDTAGVAVTGGVAAATGGLSIVANSLWNRYMNKSDPCQEASEKAQTLLDAAAARQPGKPDNS